MTGIYDWLALHGLGIWFFITSQLGVFALGAIFGPKLVTKAESAIDTIRAPHAQG